MNKIATPQDLQAELRRLLAYTQESQPSRTVLASELRDLADKVASNPKAEVVAIMAKILGETVNALGKDEFKQILEAARWGVFRDDGGDKERLLKIKQVQNRLVHGVWAIAGQAKHGKPTNPPMSKEAADWFYDLTDAVQYTMARQLLVQEAKALGIRLDLGKLIK